MLRSEQICILFPVQLDFIYLLHAEARKWILFPQAFGLAVWTCSSYLLKNKCIESCAGKDGSFPRWGAASSVRSLPVSPNAPVPRQQGMLASVVHYSDSLPACLWLAALLRAFTFTQAWQTCPFLPVRDCIAARVSEVHCTHNKGFTIVWKQGQVPFSKQVSGIKTQGSAAESFIQHLQTQQILTFNIISSILTISSSLQAPSVT